VTTRPHNPSPNRYEGRDREVDTIVLHYTASKGSASAVAAMFALPSRKASAHFVVGRDGVTWECVDLDDGAWHAGDGRFPSAEQLALSTKGAGTIIPASAVPKKPRDVNMRSIGIEIVNAGWLDGGPNPYGEARHRNPASRSKKWESYTDKQVDAVRCLVGWCVQQVPTLKWITGHEDVTNRFTLGKPGAKLDPGPLWPWNAVTEKLRRVQFDFTKNREGWRVL
jgi:N-acetyl-anhydromuramyl-L-alanine amidase AmpD